MEIITQYMLKKNKDGQVEDMAMWVNNDIIKAYFENTTKKEDLRENTDILVTKEKFDALFDGISMMAKTFQDDNGERWLQDIFAVYEHLCKIQNNIDWTNEKLYFKFLVF